MQHGKHQQTLVNIFSHACSQLLATTNDAIIERPRDSRHGDYACAAALSLAARLKRRPSDIAADIVRHADLPDFIDSIEIANNGYINIRIKGGAKTAVINDAIKLDKNYGRAAPIDETILLEFVSANPTGPLHVGHGRAAAYGDSLAKLLEFAGYRVWREYYVNDAGHQINVLAASVWLRYFIKQHPNAAMPQGAYQGDYLNKIVPVINEFAPDLSSPNINDLLTACKALPEKEVPPQMINAMNNSFGDDKKCAKFTRLVSARVLDIIKKDLKSLNVKDFDAYFHEQSLHDKNKPSEIVNLLADHTYTKDGALWFRSTAYGDDKDRVLRRANGQLTYFTADIAYHYDKLTNKSVREKLPHRLINILGADHHGYVPRLAAAISALGFEPPETRLIQFVALINTNQRIKMSTRAGKFCALADLIQATSSDAARFFYISRKNDQHLDFDIELARDKSRKNPVHYLQYAHARSASIFRKWGKPLSELKEVDCSALADNDAVLKICAAVEDFPEAIKQAATERAAHFIATFLQNLAAAINDYYESTRFLTTNNEANSTAQLAVLAAAQITLRNGLTILGINAPETM